eukprot:UN33862
MELIFFSVGVIFACVVMVQVENSQEGSVVASGGAVCFLLVFVANVLIIYRIFVHNFSDIAVLCGFSATGLWMTG